MDPQGRSFVVHSWPTRSGVHVWTSRFTPADRWSEPEGIEDSKGITGSLRCVADGQGSALAVWIRAARDDRFNKRRVWSSRFTPEEGWNLAASIQHDFGTRSRDPDLAGDPSGRAVAVWAQDGEGRGIQASFFEPAPGWATPETIVQASETTRIGAPRVAMDDEGNALVVWEAAEEGGQTTIWATRHRREAADWSEPVRLETRPGGVSDSELSYLSIGSRPHEPQGQRIGIPDTSMPSVPVVVQEHDTRVLLLDLRACRF